MKKLFFLSFIIICFSFIHKYRWDDLRHEWSPLMNAIYEDKKDVFKKLIDKGANVNYTSATLKIDALEVAIRKNNFEATKKLILTKKFKDLQPYFFYACQQENVNIVEFLIKKGAKVNQYNENSHSALMCAVSFGSVEVLESLLKNKAEINHQRGNGGMTALMLAAYGSKTEKVKLLLKYNADKKIKDNKGKTAFDYISNSADNDVKLELKKLLE